MRRYWEIDFLRGIAVIMMVLYNYLFALVFFNIVNVNVSSGFWWLFARLTAGTFILLVGVSLSISYARVSNLPDLHKKYFKRGAKIFFFGLLITLVTWIYPNKGFIVFGILHFIGISVILGYFFVKYKYENLVIGMTLILTGIFLSQLIFDFPWLLWLGFIPANFYTLDYFPLLPWFGATLIGLFIGKMLYPVGKRNFSFKEYSEKTAVKQFCYLGRHSLGIYLLHQPLFVGILYVFIL